MLIASAVDAQSMFGKAWDWTRSNPMQPNGLPAGRIDAGAASPIHSPPATPMPMAWVSLRDEGPNRQEHRAAGLQLANAALEHEDIFTTTGTGRWRPGRGPWIRARQRAIAGSAAFDDLAGLTGNSKWAVMAEQVPTVLGELTKTARRCLRTGRNERRGFAPSSSPQGVPPARQPCHKTGSTRSVRSCGPPSAAARGGHDAARRHALSQNPVGRVDEPGVNGEARIQTHIPRRWSRPRRPPMLPMTSGPASHSWRRPKTCTGRAPASSVPPGSRLDACCCSPMRWTHAQSYHSTGSRTGAS